MSQSAIAEQRRKVEEVIARRILKVKAHMRAEGQMPEEFEDNHVNYPG